MFLNFGDQAIENLFIYFLKVQVELSKPFDFQLLEDSEELIRQSY